MRVTDFEIPAQPDREWIHEGISLLGESSALNDEIEHPLDPFVDHDTYSQAAEEARLRANAILQRWRALPRPQDPHFIEADRLFARFSSEDAVFVRLGSLRSGSWRSTTRPRWFVPSAFELDGYLQPLQALDDEGH